MRRFTESGMRWNREEEKLRLAFQDMQQATADIETLQDKVVEAEQSNADGGMFKKCSEIREPPFPLSIIQATNTEQRIIHYPLSIILFRTFEILLILFHILCIFWLFCCAIFEYFICI